GAGQDPCDALDQRQSRSHAAAVPLSAGRALERHGQRRRRGELLVRGARTVDRAAEDDVERGPVMDYDRRDFMKTTLAAAAFAQAQASLFPGFETRKLPTPGP